VPFNVTVCETVKAMYASGLYDGDAGGNPCGGVAESVAFSVAPAPAVAAGSVIVAPYPPEIGLNEIVVDDPPIVAFAVAVGRGWSILAQSGLLDGHWLLALGVDDPQALRSTARIAGTAFRKDGMVYGTSATLYSHGS